MHVSTGIAITFQSGFFAEIIDVTPPDMSRVSIPTSHMETPSSAHTFKPGKLIDNGSLTVDIAFEPGTEPPIDEDASEVVITFADSGASTMTFDGFMTGGSPAAPLEDRMTMSVTIKVTGPISWG